MSKFKDENDISGYGFASDDKYATIISFSDEEATDIIIPAQFNGLPLRRIAFGAFRGCQNLHSVVLPDTVKIIENSAFRGCPSLDKIVLSKNTENIAPYAFASCSNLKSVTLPSDLKALSDKSFQKCYSLTDFIVIDKNKDDNSSKQFVVASKNEHRRFGFMNACLIYFDNYRMTKYDEGYSVIQEFDDLFNIAAYRLANPEQLTNYMFDVYQNAIRMFIPKLIREDQVERLAAAGDLGIIKPEKLNAYLELANQTKGNCIAYLLEFKERNGLREDKNFDL